MKQLKPLTVLLVLCVLTTLLSPCAHAAKEPPTVQSATIYLADPNTGYVYFERNSTQRVYPASLTKIMTALLIVEAVERGELSTTDPVTALTGFDWDMIEDGSSAGILEGETLTLRDLLACTLMASANEAANILAMHLSGSTEAFVEQMNLRAAELGCRDTYFVNPHGLPNDDHHTTAYDMFLIAREAMTHKLFADLCGSELYTVPATNLNEPRVLLNTNGLITQIGKYKDTYYYEPAIGIKTGHTNQAGYCLVSQAVQGQVAPICVILGGNPVKLSKTVTGNTAFSDSIALYQWTFDAFTPITLLDASTISAEITVRRSSDGDCLSLRPAQTISGILPKDFDPTQATATVVLWENSVTAPIAEGQVLGEITISVDGVVFGQTALVAAQAMALKPSAAWADRWFNPLLLTILLVFALCAAAAILWLRRCAAREQARQAAEELRLQQQRRLEQEERNRLIHGPKHRAQRAAARQHRPNQEFPR